MRISIYQVLPRLYGNLNATKQTNGSLETNGSGKLNDFTTERLKEIRELGCTHVWYTGVIEHATKSSFGSEIPANNTAIVKGGLALPMPSVITTISPPRSLWRLLLVWRSLKPSLSELTRLGFK